MGAPASRAVLNSLHCKRMTGNFLASKALATAQLNLNDLKIHRFRLWNYCASGKKEKMKKKGRTIICITLSK